MGGLSQSLSGMSQPDPSPKGLTQPSKRVDSASSISDLTQPKGGLTEPLADPSEGLSQLLSVPTGPQGSLNELLGEDVRTYRFPLCSTGLCPPLGPKPCLHKRLPQQTTKQGKGTDDHLLPLGDWLLPPLPNTGLVCPKDCF